MCKVSLRTRDKAREEEWKMWQQDINDKESHNGKTLFYHTLKPLGRKFVLNPALVVHTSHFCMLLLWIRMRDPALLLTPHSFMYKKPRKHKLTIAAVTPNEWTHRLYGTAHSGWGNESVFRVNVRGCVLLCLQKHPLKISLCEAKPTISKRSHLY